VELQYPPAEPGGADLEAGFVIRKGV